MFSSSSMAPQYTIVVRPSSLVILLKQKPLNDITTKDIIESAEASRKTFYTYYKDKRDLLMEIEGAIITDLQEALKEDP